MADIRSLDPEVNKLVNLEAMGQNAVGLGYVRSVMGIATGAACGVLELTGLYGFAFYLLMHVLTQLALLNKMGFDVAEYLPGESSPLRFVASGVGEQLLSFIMFWTFSFAVVHIY